MNKWILLIIVFITLHARAQTLFTYGDHAVSKEEFLRAYNKNNYGQQPATPSYRDYLELYLRFKLKVQAALDKKMDTLPGQQADLQSFREQAADGFMTDESTVQALVKEAFERSKKDLHLAHIFIPFRSGQPGDTLIAFQRATDAYNELKKGTEFGNVARIYSADSMVQLNGGDIGFITVFTLPYALETVAYTTPPGSFSQPWRSKAGYHIFKNKEDRPAIGKMKAAQILFFFPPEAGDSIKNRLRLKADSVYTALQKGASFEELVKRYSDDNLTYQLGGEMPEFTTGTYDPVLERAVFGLPKNGAITPPISTHIGYHIIKRIALTPVNTNPDSTDALLLLRGQVMNDERSNLAREVLTKKVYRLLNLSPDTYNEEDLLQLYRDSLEQYNPEFAAQLQEFKEGNLLFEIMQRTIWDKPVAEQAILEEQWIAELKKKYPVWINEDVLNTL